MNTSHPYDQLTPDTVLNAVESAGLWTDARILALNSYENRVYQVGQEEGEPVVVKFYRPQRWSRAQIEEEHQFLFELEALEIPVIAPLRLGGSSLFEYNQFLFAIFPRRGGRRPEPEDFDSLYRIGQYIGRMHACGATTPFRYRPTLSMLDELRSSRQFLLDHAFIPGDLLPAYESITEDLIRRITDKVTELPAPTMLRLHGDCHASNILQRDEQIFFVDFDDCRNGPAVQDLWLMLSGDTREQSKQLSELVEGYEDFHSFNAVELHLIEPLRTLRIINYAAWLARRWEDPAFPHHFPWFNTARYWSDHILELREQQAALQEPPLRLL